MVSQLLGAKLPIDFKDGNTLMHQNQKEDSQFAFTGPLESLDTHGECHNDLLDHANCCASQDVDFGLFALSASRTHNAGPVCPNVDANDSQQHSHTVENSLLDLGTLMNPDDIMPEMIKFELASQKTDFWAASQEVDIGAEECYPANYKQSVSQVESTASRHQSLNMDTCSRRGSISHQQRHAKKHNNRYGLETPPLLKSSCSKMQQYIYWSYWKHRYQRGNERWTNIQDDLRHVFDKTYDVDMLRQEWQRARIGGIQWFWEDVSDTPAFIYWWNNFKLMRASY